MGFSKRILVSTEFSKGTGFTHGFSSDKDRMLSKDIVSQRKIKSQATSIDQRVISVWLRNYNV